MTRTIASILNIVTLICYIIAVVFLTRDMLKATVLMLLIGQFIEFIHRYVRTDLDS